MCKECENCDLYITPEKGGEAFGQCSFADTDLKTCPYRLLREEVERLKAAGVKFRPSSKLVLQGKTQADITCNDIPGFQGFSGKTAEEKDPEPAPEPKQSVRDLEYFPDFTQRPREAPQTIALRGYCVSGFTQGETVRQAIAGLTLEALTSEFDEAEQAAILMLHRKRKEAA